MFATLPLSLFLPFSLCLPHFACCFFLLIFALLLFGKLIGLRALIAEVGVLAAKLFMAFSMTIFIASQHSAGFKNFSLHTLRRMSIWRPHARASEAALVIMMWNLCVAALSSPYRAPALSLCPVPFTLLCLTEFFWVLHNGNVMLHKYYLKSCSQEWAEWGGGKHMGYPFQQLFKWGPFHVSSTNCSLIN